MEYAAPNMMLMVKMPWFLTKTKRISHRNPKGTKRGFRLKQLGTWRKVTENKKKMKALLSQWTKCASHKKMAIHRTKAETISWAKITLTKSPAPRELCLIILKTPNMEVTKAVICSIAMADKLLIINLSFQITPMMFSLCRHMILRGKVLANFRVKLQDREV